jgi:hypothetical protein
MIATSKNPTILQQIEPFPPSDRVFFTPNPSQNAKNDGMSGDPRFPFLPQKLNSRAINMRVLTLLFTKVHAIPSIAVLHTLVARNPLTFHVTDTFLNL